MREVIELLENAIYAGGIGFIVSLVVLLLTVRAEKKISTKGGDRIIKFFVKILFLSAIVFIVAGIIYTCLI